VTNEVTIMDMSSVQRSGPFTMLRDVLAGRIRG